MASREPAPRAERLGPCGLQELPRPAIIKGEAGERRRWSRLRSEALDMHRHGVGAERLSSSKESTADLEPSRAWNESSARRSSSRERTATRRRARNSGRPRRPPSRTWSVGRLRRFTGWDRIGPRAHQNAMLHPADMAVVIVAVQNSKTNRPKT